jgi:hypothetical protein
MFCPAAVSLLITQVSERVKRFFLPAMRFFGIDNNTLLFNIAKNYLF